MQPMSFQLMFSIEDVNAWTPTIRKNVFEWLFSPRTYVDFKSADDYDSVGMHYEKLYKVIFTSPLEFNAINLTNGYFTLTAKSHPFAYTEVTTQNETISSSPTQITINNPTNVRGADNTFYYYPTLNITMVSGTTFKMVNTSDSNREFEFTGLETTEVLSVNNALKYITTDEADTNRIADLTDKQWFRLVQGDNVINVYADCTLQIVSQFPIML